MRGGLSTASVQWRRLLKQHDFDLLTPSHNTFWLVGYVLHPASNLVGSTLDVSLSQAHAF